MQNEEEEAVGEEDEESVRVRDNNERAFLA